MFGIVYPAGKALGTVCMLGLALVSNCTSTTTTIDFDDLKPGTSVGTHYRYEVPVGLEFVAEGECPLPKVAAAERARSRPNVANLGYTGEYSMGSCARARLDRPADRVQVFVASAAQQGQSGVTLTARGADGKVVAESRVIVLSGADSSTPLEVRTTGGVITSFSLDAYGASLWIDNVTFDQPGDEPTYP